MADFEEELRLDDEENAREVEYILDVLPADLKEKYSEADLRYMMDTIVDYYFESGVLEADADEEGYVDIDLQKVADYVCAKASRAEATSIRPRCSSWCRPTWTSRSKTWIDLRRRWPAGNAACRLRRMANGAVAHDLRWSCATAAVLCRWLSGQCASKSAGNAFGHIVTEENGCC